MSVRIRITLLFTLVVMLIWGAVCLAIYYFSYQTRESSIQRRLSNRAVTTARLLEQSEIFDQDLIRRIDSVTTLSLKRKSVQAYAGPGPAIYYYSELPDDTLRIDPDLLQRAVKYGEVYFHKDGKDVVAYHDAGNQESLVVICAAIDQEGKDELHDLTRILLLCFIGGSVASFAGGYIFSIRLLQPVRRIANEVNEISAYSLDRRIAVSGGTDEWQELAATLNHLLDRLRESFELQRRFISNASHELSTPLTLISSQLEISLQRERSTEEYRKVMNLALQDVRNMAQLVQTLLKFASASGDAGGLNIRPLRIDEILMRMPAEMQQKDKANSVSLRFENLPEQDSSLLVVGNEELLFTAIRNIVSNACKYSADRHADVKLEVSEKKLIITISDNGIGIHAADMEHIFHPFFRAKIAAGYAGSGLGLPLANRIIKLHKGSIEVWSEPGKGSVFTITLPATRTADA